MKGDTRSLDYSSHQLACLLPGPIRVLSFISVSISQDDLRNAGSSSKVEGRCCVCVAFQRKLPTERFARI